MGHAARGRTGRRRRGSGPRRTPAHPLDHTGAVGRPGPGRGRGDSQRDPGLRRPGGAVRRRRARPGAPPLPREARPAAGRTRGHPRGHRLRPRRRDAAGAGRVRPGGLPQRLPRRPQVFWDRVLACAGETPLGHEAALTLTAPLLRYCDFVSTHAGHAYVESQQYVVADADRERRDLLEHLLAGAMPTRGPLVAAARAYGLGADTPMMVALAVPVGPQADADTPHAASAMITRAVPRQA